MTSLMRWRPLEEELSEFFGDAFKLSPFLSHKLGWDLAIDVFEEDNNIVAKMAIPGVNPDEIDISVEEWNLHLSGSRDEAHETKDKHYYRKEIRCGKFERSVSLPAAVDPDKVSAECKDGVLSVIMPKKAKDQKKKVKIAINTGPNK